MKLKCLSASQIKTYEQCNFRFLLEYHLRLPKERGFAAEQGSLVHYVLECFALAKKDGQDEKGRTWEYLEKNWKQILIDGYPDRYDNQIDGYAGDDAVWKLNNVALETQKECDTCPYAINGKYCSIHDKKIDEFDGCPRYDYENAIRLVENVINDKSNKNPLNHKIIDAEKQFKLDLPEEGQVSGLIDVVTEIDEDTIEIHDYKTGNYKQSYNACMQDVQMLTYHWAAHKVYPQYKNVINSIYYISDLNTPIKHWTLAIGKSHDIQTEKYLQEIWYKIKNDVTPQRCSTEPHNSKFPCQVMCNPTLCNIIYKKFLAQGGKTSA